MDYLYYIFGALIFGVVLLIAAAGVSWKAAHNPASERVARRLRSLNSSGAEQAQAVSITKQRLLSKRPSLHQLLSHLPQAYELDRLLLQAGRRWDVAQFSGIVLAAAGAGLLLGALLHLPLLLLLLSGSAGALPLIELVRAKSRRLARIEQQLPDALDLMGRAMRAGHAFPTALKMIGEEMKDPLAAEFRAVFEEVNFGVAMSDALMNLANRVPSTDLRYFVVAVLIQRETGGNLSELLTSIGTIIRDRIKLLGQVRVLSAEGRLSAWILSLLPFGAGLMMYLSNPEFASLLFTDPTGQKMLGGAGVMMLTGIFVIRRITHIRV